MIHIPMFTFLIPDSFRKAIREFLYGMTMRLLPHIIPHLEEWKKGICRERDITEIFTTDL